MNRRELFKLILPVAAGAIIAPELLLPHRSFFLPPVGGWHSKLLTVDMITREALEILEANLVITDRINRRQALEDLKFYRGDQWERLAMVNAGRPLYSHNIEQALNRVIGDWS